MEPHQAYRQPIKMFLEFCQRDKPMYRHAIAHDVQV